MQQPEIVDYEFRLDGEVYNVAADFTFKESREYREIVRDLTGDPTIQPIEAPAQDRLPAMVTVIKRRTDPDYTPEQALEDYKFDDLVFEVKVEKDGKKRPTRARAASSS